VGAVSGLLAGVILALPVVAVTGAGGLGGQAVLILAGFVAQGIAGYVAGRFAAADEILHGGLAALSIYLVAAAVSIASGSDPAAITLLAGGLIALVLGSAAGVLAAGRRRAAEEN
jgi:hypothetical protein